VEYAVEAINHAGAAIGIRTNTGIVLATEKRVLSKLLESTVTEKLHRIDSHVMAASAGVNADAEILVNSARLLSQRHKFNFGQSIPVEVLVQSIADQKQGYTQFGGLRPYGVSFIFAGWDNQLGFQLYQSDPSGNYVGWQAAAIGANSQTALSILKSEYQPDLLLEDAKKLALKVLRKIMDVTALSSESVEVLELTVLEGALLTKRLTLREILQSSELP
jgi:20S proteasome subunit alpha 3